MTCTDQDTGEVGKEPLVTLKNFRSSKALGWDLSKSAVFFGWNLVPKAHGVIRIDDNIQITKRRETHVAVPSKTKKTQSDTVAPQVQAKSQQAMIREGLWAALQGASVAVAVAAVLISFMYYLIKATAPEADLVEPT